MLSSQIDINNIPTPDNIKSGTLSGLHDMKGQFMNFQQTITNSFSDIPGVADMIATQDNAGQDLPDFNNILSEIGLTPDDMKKYTEKLIRGGGCAVGDHNCKDKVNRAKVATELTQANLAYDKAKELRDKTQKQFELVEFGGETGLSKHKFKLSEAEGEKVKDEKIKNHNFMRNKIQNNINVLIDQNVYEGHIDDLATFYDSTANETHDSLERIIDKNNLDGRKVFYEEQSTSIYVWINSNLNYIYWIMLIVLLCFELYKWFNGKLNYSPYSILGYSLFMLLYPFLMDTIVGGILFILKIIYNNSPKDVYVDL